jgi:hypothetical protein
MEELKLDELERLTIENIQLKGLLLQKELENLDKELKSYILQLEEKYGVKIVGIKDIQNGIVMVEKRIN